MMKILVLANDSAWNELTGQNCAVEWIRAQQVADFKQQEGLDAYFVLTNTFPVKDLGSFEKPVFIDSVPGTLKKLNAPVNVLRINGWNGFLKRRSWEVAGTVNEDCKDIFKAMEKDIIHVPDEPGFIAARVIAMIINEAYFARGESVSTEKEIDIAMKLGTNYPYGPFEWASIIGKKHIYALLQTLSETDARYKPSILLGQEALQLQ